MGFDHHQVAEVLLRHWCFPSMLIDIIRHWGTPNAWPAEMDGDTRALVHLVHMADMTCRVIWEPLKDQALKALHSEGFTFYGIAAVELDAYFLGLEANLAETAALFDIEMAKLNDFSAILDDARDQMVQVSLGAVLDLRQSTAHVEELERERKHLSSLAQTDKLTGILNRAGFEATLQQIIEARVQDHHDCDLGLLMIDIDHFKAFNDTYGHLVGDKVLQQVARWIASATRNTDIAARYGGEEFVVIVPNVTCMVLEQVAERIRLHVSHNEVIHEDQPLTVTISIGGACLHQVNNFEDGVALLKIADQCLYEAKGAGRNRSICREISALPYEASRGQVPQPM
jgi:diguanylate cyclase (GGDEF)-like protein